MLKNYNPDVLTCIANLSNDEVFTPPNLANLMLDLLPKSIWSNDKFKFLDPSCKTGIFLREIVKRLDEGLEKKIPNKQARINHILKNQVYGIAITELTSLLSRRSVYCSKSANSQYSVATDLAEPQGNIRFERTEHHWIDGKCSFCGAGESEYQRDDSLESHAYEFIHHKNIEELLKMKFDVIIGNPPYQLNDGGNGVSAKPIFHLFVRQAKKLNPKYLSMIIPARWYAGGKGLDDFREEMLNDKRMKTLVDFESSKDCFEGVNIAGGICYFLWENSHEGDCEVINSNRISEKNSIRPLNEFPVFIRANNSISIVKKVLKLAPDTWVSHNYPRNPFGFSTKDRGEKTPSKDSIELVSSEGIGYVKRVDVKKNPNLIDKYKVLIGRLVPSNGELDVNPADGYRVITNTRILKPGQIHTESYLLIGAFKTLQEAKNFEGFIKLKFSRFLLRQAISSVNVTKECFRFVPLQDFKESWTDEKLYKLYGLNQSEVNFIEETIRAVGDDLE
jgi:site-specific DNA-methyltransferase (adenine-specific)